MVLSLMDSGCIGRDVWCMLLVISVSDAAHLSGGHAGFPSLSLARVQARSQVSGAR